MGFIPYWEPETAVEIAKRIPTEEKLDRQLAEQSIGAPPFFNNEGREWTKAQDRSDNETSVMSAQIDKLTYVLAKAIQSETIKVEADLWQIQEEVINIIIIKIETDFMTNTGYIIKPLEMIGLEVNIIEVLEDMLRIKTGHMTEVKVRIEIMEKALVEMEETVDLRIEVDPPLGMKVKKEGVGNQDSL